MSASINSVLSGPVLCVVGARPNFMKMAPILRALAAHEPPLSALLVHTGQHYDQDMSDRLFEDLGLPRPDVNLDVGSGATPPTGFSSTRWVASPSNTPATSTGAPRPIASAAPPNCNPSPGTPPTSTCSSRVASVPATA